MSAEYLRRWVSDAVVLMSWLDGHPRAEALDSVDALLADNQRKDLELQRLREFVQRVAALDPDLGLIDAHALVTDARALAAVREENG